MISIPCSTLAYPAQPILEFPNLSSKKESPPSPAAGPSHGNAIESEPAGAAAHGTKEPVYQCSYCGEDLTPAQARRMGRYCSVQCSGRARRSTVTRKCAYCEQKFLVEPRHPNARYCSPQCYGISQRGRNRSVLSPEREAVRRAKIKEALRTRANIEGLRIGQKAPSRIPIGLANPNSKRWVLQSPEGCTYECYGLRSWAKANAELFGWFDPSHKTPPHFIILQRLCVVASGRAEHFRGWTVLVRDGLPVELHRAAIGEIYAAAKARKAVRERERRQRRKLTAYLELLRKERKAA